jgi:signal transduction histidine kinase
LTLPTTSTAERTEVLYGTENVINEELRFFSKTKSRIDTCMDHTRPSLAIGIESIKWSFLDAKKRGVRLRYLTEITNANISYCKELMQLLHELRHLDGVKGNFMISETEYLAPASSHEETKPSSLIIYTNVKEIVEHQQYVFETLWNKAIPANQKIREIGEGIISTGIRLIENRDEIIKEIKRKNNNANKLSICSTFGGMQMSYNNLFDSYKNVVDKHRRGENKEGMRWIINIDKESIDLVKIFLNDGIQIRHVKNMPPMNFGVSDQEIAVTLEKMEGGRMSQSFLISNEHLYINHFNSLFDELWKNGIDAKDRIKDIEQGTLGDIEVIPNSARAKELYLNLVKSANEEVLLIFPTTNAFIRQHKMGVIRLATEAAQQRNAKVRILMPMNESTEPLVRRLTEEDSHHYRKYDIDVRYYIEQSSGTKATILLVDRKASLVMELRDDSKGTFEEAIGLSTYSNSRSGVLSYVSIFENLWMQTELYEQVKEVNERLKLHDKMQQEFINVAAHELRTPIQPILGLAGVLRSKLQHGKQENEYLDVIIRNAKRLQRLSEDILDITKIESKSLGLKKELFNINEVILNAIADSNNQIVKENKDHRLKLRLVAPKEDIFIEADKGRISQVISNLLSNAIKFTNEGSINLAVEKKDNNQEILVNIQDTGTGIHPEILPRLFTKFATKSEIGTGLGLFISKSIVEAHVGKIWAENNRGVVGEKGATFYFTLPIANSSRK